MLYMDAVFYPNIYQSDKTFRQEGWSYKLDSADADLEISGVVYNEMKGAVLLAGGRAGPGDPELSFPGYFLCK